MGWKDEGSVAKWKYGKGSCAARRFDDAMCAMARSKFDEAANTVGIHRLAGLVGGSEC